MDKCYVTFFSILFFTISVSAQNAGEVCFELNKKAVLKIDNVVYDQSSLDHKEHCLSLRSGIHTIKIWTPRYKIVEDTFNVVANESIVYSKALVEFNQEYQIFRENFSQYKEQKNKRIRKNTLLFGTGALAAGTLLLGSKSLRNSRAELLEYKNEYNSGTDAFTTLRAYDNFVAARKSYNTKLLLFAQIPLAASVTFNIWGIKNILKNKKTPLIEPEFQSQSPW